MSKINQSVLITGSLLSNPAPELSFAEWSAGTKAIQDIVDKYDLTDVAEGAAFGFLNIDLLYGKETSSEEFYFMIAQIITHADVQKLNMDGFFTICEEGASITVDSPADLVIVEGNQVIFQTSNRRIRTVVTEQKLHD